MSPLPERFKPMEGMRWDPKRVIPLLDEIKQKSDEEITRVLTGSKEWDWKANPHTYRALLFEANQRNLQIT